jgi:hypothetical protein
MCIRCVGIGVKFCKFTLLTKFELEFVSSVPFLF